VAPFLIGRAEIVAFLKQKWQREQQYRLIKELWRLIKTVLRCGSPMSGMMRIARGIALMGMRTGHVMSRV